MSKFKPIILAVFAIAGVAMLSGNVLAQDCGACGSSVDSFGYPSGGGVAQCSTGRGIAHGGHANIDHWKAKFEELKAFDVKVSARNAAWPKPFNCADRQLYFAIWEPMIDQGFEEQCVLTSSHFDSESGQLNQFGQHTVAAIMQNMPDARKKVFVHREANDQINNTRLAAVKQTINTFYGESGPARVEFSTKLGVKLRGQKAEAITRLSAENMPPPIIAISSGETIGSSVGN